MIDTSVQELFQLVLATAILGFCVMVVGGVLLVSFVKIMNWWEGDE